jgi:ligand-binding sensor domain-containing protein/signal transduction histidine kinase
MSKKKRYIFLFVLTLLILPAVFYAQSLALRHYSARDGLPSSFTTCILQDSRGYLWFGTEFGLSRFNGSEFQTKLDEKHGLRNDYIIDLFEDRTGTLWVGTRGGGLIRINSSGIKAYTSADGLPDNNVSSIVEDEDKILWLGTRAGISAFDGKTFVNYSTKDGLVDNFILDLLLDKKGKLWIGTLKGLSCFVDRKKKGSARFINYTQSNSLISDEINRLMLDRNGNIWIGTNNGLYCYQNEKGEKNARFIAYTTKDGLPNDWINTVMQDSNSNIWIGTETGLSRLSLSTGKFTNYYTRNGFLHGYFYTIFEDREGNLWFGTRMGVSRLNSFKITNFSINDGLPDNFIWAIIEGAPGKYWIGTDKGLSCYSAGKFTTYTTRKGLINDIVYNLLKDRAGNIWIATHGGLSVYSSQKGTFTNYEVKDGLPCETLLSLSEAGDGTIWIGTERGLCRFVNGKIEPPGFKYNATESPIQAVLNDSKGNLWFSDSGGLWKVSGNRAIYYTMRDGLVDNYIFSLFEDSRGRIWIGTKGGVSCLSNGQFTNYSKANGLSQNGCIFILEDDQQDLWIGTVNGLIRFNGKSFRTYTDRDGLISSEMSHSTCLKDSQGNLWFGTVDGITRFNPHLERKNTVAPLVYITSLSVVGKGRPLSPHLSLKHDENYIRFEFIGLCFTSPEDVVYKYRLKSIEKEWFETKDRYILYPSLNPGSYVFEVTAKNNDGVENPDPVKFSFRILPPFWQTWWFQMLSGLVLFSAIVLLVFFQIRRVKNKMADEARNKQFIMAQRMKLMGVLAGGAVHDLKNLLSIIIGYSDLVHEYDREVKEEDKNEAVEIIKSTADTAFQVVKQILAFTRQTYDESKAFNLSELITEILTILKITIPPTIVIQWEPPAEDILARINPVKFKQVVMNLCLNAVQAMEEKGALKISLARVPKGPAEGSQVIIVVTDTGPGIKEEDLGKIFDPLFTTKAEDKGAGLGLFVVKQIVEEFKGTIQVRSKIGEGTVFHLSLPFQSLPSTLDN